MPHAGRAAHQPLGLPGQRRNREHDDGGEGYQRKHQQDHTDEARDVIRLRHSYGVTGERQWTRIREQILPANLGD